MRYHFSTALWWNTRYRDAAAIQRDVFQMADRLGDSRSKAYSLTGEIFTSVMLATKSLGEIRDTKKQAISAAANTQDAYVQNWTWAAIGWDYTAYALPASFELRHSYRNQGGRAAMPPGRRCFVWSTTFQ
jgi:ElaB/YqjD/DUF883 family membrane-anchored ribosome-binding protein